MIRTFVSCFALAMVTLVAAPPTHAAQVFAPYQTTFLVRDDGTLWAWGWNEYGQIGDGTTASRPSPVPVLSGVKAVAGGTWHSAILKTDGSLLVTGYNPVGALGVGNNSSKTVPFKMMSDVRAVAAGYSHTVALKNDGSVWAWGDSPDGAVGDGTTTRRLSPVQVMTGVRAIGAGARTTYAVKNDGSLWAWGRNTRGTLGDGTTTTRLSPVRIMDDVQAVVGGDFQTLALKTDGSVWAWGGNDQGQLGDGTTTDRLLPVQVLSGVKAIAAGSMFAMALKTDNSLWMWGNNGSGELGYEGQSRETPFMVMQGVQSIAGGSAHAVVTRLDGSVESWGYDAFGQIGDGGIVERSFPVLSLTGVRSVAGGLAHTLAVKSDNTLWTWGAYGGGRLGDDQRTVPRAEPTKVMDNVREAAAGGTFSLVIRTDGSLWTFGENVFGQLGNGTTIINSPTPPAQVMTGVSTVAGGYAHTLIVKTDGSLASVGNNTAGQLGDGTTVAKSTPATIMANVKSVAAGGDSSYAVKTDGTLWTWGLNIWGQLGDGTIANRSSPAQILDNVKAVAAGNLHGLALRNDGSVWGWGFGGFGAVGAGTFLSPRSPLKIIDSGVVAIAAHGYHSVVLKSDGTLWSWGENAGWGGTTTFRPTQILSVRNVTAIGAGGTHTMGVTADGRLFSWGSNISAQLGIARAENIFGPTKSRDSYVPIAGSNIVWEFYNPLIRNGAGTQGAGHYFMTADPVEAAAIDSGVAGAGWERTGRVFRAWTAQAAAPAGAVGVCRFYASGPNSHFYTAAPGECAALKAANPANTPSAGWAYEGIAFYTVLPVFDPNPPPAGSIAFVAGSSKCAAGYQPVYRVYNNRFNPDPKLNDSNHRMTPSISDAYRSKTYLGYADEGIAFCSPIRDVNEGGDYQAYYLYPGADVSTGSALKTSFVFSNNGAQRGDGALAYAILPSEVTNWSVTCEAFNGATCPATLDADRLREGQPIPKFPGGSFVVLTARGTAPSAPGSNNYAAVIAGSSGAPDYLLANNVPVTSQTVVRSPVVCSYVISPATLALVNTAQTVQARVAAPASCRWSIASDQTWLQLSPATGTGDRAPNVVAVANPGGVSRTATITLTALDPQGQPLPGNTKTLAVTQAGTPAAPVDNANAGCLTTRTSREGDQFGSDGITGAATVNLIADTSCNWTTKSSVPWVTVVRGSGGAGNASIQFQVDLNPDPDLRIGEVRIANRTFTVTQLPARVNIGSTTGGCADNGGCGESGSDGGGGGDGGSSGGSGAGSGGSGAGG